MASRASIASHPGYASSGSSSSQHAPTASASSTSISSRFSLPATSSPFQALPSSLTNTLTSATGAGKRPNAASSSTNHVNILDRPVAKTRNAEVGYAAWAFLFSEIIQYTQRRVNGIADFEARWGYHTSEQYQAKQLTVPISLNNRLSTIGYRVGIRLVELEPLRNSLPPSTSRNATGPPRQTRLLPVLQYVHTTVFRNLFGRPASSLERSTENEDEYMIGDDDPVLDRGVQIPKEMSSLSTNALLAGIVEAVMDGLGFVSARNMRISSEVS